MTLQNLEAGSHMLCLLLHLQIPILILFFLKAAFFLEGLFFFFKPPDFD